MTGSIECKAIKARGFPCALEGEFVSYNVFVYCGDNPILREDDGGKFWETIIVGAVIGGLIGGVSAALNGSDAKEIVLATFEGAATGGLCAAGGWFVVAGALVHGTYTATTSEGDSATRLKKGIAAAGSTLLWGGLGNIVTSGLNSFDSIIGNILFDIEFGIAATINNYIIESSIEDTTGELKQEEKTNPFYRSYYQFEVVAI